MDGERIRLLEFVALFAVGGTERHVVNLARGLDPARFELQLACLKRSGHFLGELEACRVPILEYGINSLYKLNTFKAQLRFARFLRDNRIGIMHSYGFYCNVFAIPAARLAGVPVIVASIRDMGDVWTPIQRRLQRAVCRLAHCVLVNAEAVKQRLIAEGYSPKKIAVIRNGIALSRFQRQREGAAVRREIGLPPAAPVVVVLSRLIRMKGIEYFLEAAAIVSRRIPEARFLIVGDSVCYRDRTQVVGDRAYRSELEEYARRLGVGQRVVFTGFRLDVPDLLSEAAISVLPSLSEGLSNVLLESMAAGVPVVATNVGGNREAVEDGVTGWLVPPRDARALAHAVGVLLGNPALAARFGRAGRQRVAEHFSLQGMVRETERLYLKLVGDGRSTPAAEAGAAGDAGPGETDPVMREAR
ncbi:MAG: GT4 family glycosyltransferase PelF [Candidatus Rokubacteria bacterium]|nr:GT4 family glycosyltransferase PelF [Candidatus Rokubacteria bacterium]